MAAWIRFAKLHKKKKTHQGTKAYQQLISPLTNWQERNGGVMTLPNFTATVPGHFVVIESSTISTVYRSILESNVSLRLTTI